MKLEIDSVVFSRGGKSILSDVYLSLSDSEVVGLLGRNGAGKTTLFNILFGAQKADFCNLRLDGKRISSQNQRLEFLKYLPQASFLPSFISLNSAMKFFQLDSGKTEILLELVNETGRLKVSQLSGGQKRLTELLLILFSKSPFILLDEPFSGLSPLVIDKLLPLITEGAKNKGILITDHHYRTVMKVSDRLILMREGATLPIINQFQLLENGYISHKGLI